MVLGALGAGIAGGAVVSIVIQAIDHYSATFANVNKGMLLMGAAVAAAGAAIAAGMFKAGQAFAEVETGFAKVNTLLDEGQDAQELYGDFVSKTNVVLGNQGDQLDALAGLYQTVSAGITDATESQHFMGLATKAAVGGSAKLSTVILAGTKAIAAFGLEVSETERVFDVFAATVKAGQTTMEELATSFPNVAGMAGQAGITIEETMGTFAGLTKVLASSEETATALSATIRGFIKPTEDMKKAVQSLGFENATSMVKSLGLNEALKRLNESIDGDTQAMAKLFPNVRALKAVFPLLGLAADDVAQSIDIVSNSTGLSQKQFEDMTNTVQYQWGVAMSSAKNVLIDVGRVLNEVFAPIVKGIAIILTKFSEIWMAIPDPIKKVIVVVASLAAGILILGGVFMIFNAIAPIFAGMITLVTGTLTGMAAALTAVSIAGLPLWIIIVAIIAIIAALIFIGYMLIKHWDKVKIFFIKFGVGIQNVFITIRNTVAKVWNGIVDIIEKSINAIIKALNGLIRGINRIPGIKIPIIPRLNLSRWKAQMKELKRYVAPVAERTAEEEADVQARVKEIIDKYQGSFVDVKKPGESLEIAKSAKAAQVDTAETNKSISKSTETTATSTSSIANSTLALEGINQSILDVVTSIASDVNSMAVGTKEEKIVNIYIENINGMTGQDIASSLQDELNKKITLG